MASPDWTTISSLATGAGTLVLAVATFASVRSSNRTAMIAERSFRVGLRPILAPARLDDPTQKVMFADRHWVRLAEGRAAVEVDGDTVYLAMPLRNVGNGMAVIEAWKAYPEQRVGDDDWADISEFRPQTRTLLIPPGDISFWQGALRDPGKEVHGRITAAIEAGALTVDLLYVDHEGGQRTASRFALIRQGDPGRETWWISMSRHRTIDEREEAPPSGVHAQHLEERPRTPSRTAP